MLPPARRHYAAGSPGVVPNTAAQFFNSRTRKARSCSRPASGATLSPLAIGDLRVRANDCGDPDIQGFGERGDSAMVFVRRIEHGKHTVRQGMEVPFAELALRVKRPDRFSYGVAIKQPYAVPSFAGGRDEPPVHRLVDDDVFVTVYWQARCAGDAAACAGERGDDPAKNAVATICCAR